eukprot:TRINITY_DN5435_c0_g1_i1.p1 TRINITY_DN5435_c0_g1~~TRINITY_DN5435_c0_g1_i1.p1  ORF type:complete len:302 (-),score=62.86 TRINITY_DN5435_c0_g1_i1:119-1024(-)
MTFSISDIPSQEGKVVIVTGGNSGIGKSTCKILLSKGAKVYMAARSREKAEAAIKDIKELTGKDDIHWLKLDLADFASIKEAVDEFKSKERYLHTIYNNAAVISVPIATTKDGYELSFATNTIGPFLFTYFLTPVLEHTASESPRGTVRIVWTSSAIFKIIAPTEGICFDDLSLNGRFMHAWQRYAQSKLGNVLVSNEFAKRYVDKGITSIALHPGGVATEGTASGSLWKQRLMSWFIYTPDQGALTQLYAGTTPEVFEKDLNGKYLEPIGKVASSTKQATDTVLAEKLWNFLLDIAGKIN